MTISLEEHVARAVRDVVWGSPAIAVLGHDFKDREAYRTEFVTSVARAAIAAVREREGVETLTGEPIGETISHDEGLAALNAMADSHASIRESERAACEAIVQRYEEMYVRRPEAYIMRNIREEIAARKGNGVG